MNFTKDAIYMSSALFGHNMENEEIGLNDIVQKSRQNQLECCRRGLRCRRSRRFVLNRTYFLLSSQPQSNKSFRGLMLRRLPELLRTS